MVEHDGCHIMYTYEWNRVEDRDGTQGVGKERSLQAVVGGCTHAIGDTPITVLFSKIICFHWFMKWEVPPLYSRLLRIAPHDEPWQ